MRICRLYQAAAAGTALLPFSPAPALPLATAVCIHRINDQAKGDRLKRLVAFVIVLYWQCREYQNNLRLPAAFHPDRHRFAAQANTSQRDMGRSERPPTTPRAVEKRRLYARYYSKSRLPFDPYLRFRVPHKAGDQPRYDPGSRSARNADKKTVFQTLLARLIVFCCH